MSFVPSIYEKRHEFYLNFANEFFTKDIKVAIILDFLDKNYIISSIIKFIEDK